MDKTWDATVKALEALKINVESKQHDALTGVINGKLADGKSLSVNLKRISESTTEVGVRIGTFGDRERSEAIHDKILSSL
jgi:type II secretory pathway component PulF